MPDEEFALRQLLEDGPNAVKKYFSDKISAVYPGQIDSKSINAMFNKSMSERGGARSFDKIESGKALEEEIRKAYFTTKNAIGRQYGELTDAAAKQFRGVGNKPVEEIQTVLDSIIDKKTVSGTVKNELQAMIDDIGDLSALSPEDQFRKLLEARKNMKGLVDWGSRNELPRNQKIFEGIYNLNADYQCNLLWDYLDYQK